MQDQLLNYWIQQTLNYISKVHCMHSLELNIFNNLELFFTSAFLCSNLESVRRSLIRGNHSYQVIFKIHLRFPFFFFLGFNSTKSISFVGGSCSLFSFIE